MSQCLTHMLIMTYHIIYITLYHGKWHHTLYNKVLFSLYLYIPQIDLTFILAEKLPAWENMNCLLLFILRTSWCDALRRDTIIVLSVLSRQGQPSPWIISAQPELCPTSPRGNCRIMIGALGWSQYHPPWTSFGTAASHVNVDLMVSTARKTCDMVDMEVPADLLLCGCVPRVETSIDSDRPLNDATIAII